MGDQGSIPGSERSPGEGTGYPVHYSCLGISSHSVSCLSTFLMVSFEVLKFLIFTKPNLSFSYLSLFSVSDIQATRVSLMIQMIRLQCCIPGFDSWVTKMPWRRKWQPTPVFLPGRIPWTEEPGRLQPMGVAKNQTQLSD